MVEILEKGIRNPEPYKSIYDSYQRAFPDVQLPPFSTLTGSFFESLPINLMAQDIKHHYPQSLEHTIGHFLSSRAYYVFDSEKKETFILQNNFPRLLFFGMVGYSIMKTVVPEILTNPQKAIRDSTLLGAGILASICIKRASMYHEFAHFIHNLNNKTTTRSELFIEEYISDVAAWHAMQSGSPLDKAISLLFFPYLGQNILLVLLVTEAEK